MLLKRLMKQSVKFYYLYCMNSHCPYSIYYKAVEFPITFSAQNLIATHRCNCCDHALVSAIELKIKYGIDRTEREAIIEQLSE